MVGMKRLFDYTPDADDAYMPYGLLRGKIAADGFDVALPPPPKPTRRQTTTDRQNQISFIHPPRPIRNFQEMCYSAKGTNRGID